MKKYSIFLIENGRKYQVFIQNGKFWLGGSRCEWLLFHTKSEAEKVAKDARKQKLPFFEKGTIKVMRARLSSF